MASHPPPDSGRASFDRLSRWQRPALVLYTCFLAYVSLAPSRQLPKIPQWTDLFSPDKVAHFGAYAFFTLLLSVELFPRLQFRGVALAVTIASLFGGLMEILQGATSMGRSADPVDMVANCIGACVGGLVFTLLYTIKQKLSRTGRA